MNIDAVQPIADAVLYEGYLLYPYRQTAVKNQQRWTFGGVYPPAYSTAQRGADASTMRTESLITGNDARVTVRVRFLHVTERSVGEQTSPPDFRLVDELWVGDRVYRSWQEAVERVVEAVHLPLAGLIAAPTRVPIHFPASREIEPLRDATNDDVGVLIRTQQAIDGAIVIGAERLGEDLYKLSVQIENLTRLATVSEPRREDALPQTFISTHTIMGVQDGAFISLTDPPTGLESAVAGCQNVGTWPVLVGEEGDRSLMLSSPIILPDYPQIAPESAADLFDGTEIDEILTLRIMTLTDDEKREIQQSDPRGHELLARTEAIPEEQFRKMHGVLRGLRQLDGDAQ